MPAEAQEPQGPPQPQEPPLRRLLEVGRVLMTELDLESVLEQVLQTARELTGAQYAALGTLIEDRSALVRFLPLGIDEPRREIAHLRALIAELRDGERGDSQKGDRSELSEDGGHEDHAEPGEDCEHEIPRRVRRADGYNDAASSGRSM